MNKNTLTIYGLSDTIAYCEAQGLSKCFQAYAENCSRLCYCPSLTDGGIGFNSNSGYVYIGLENGIQICSMLGQDVEYLVTDFETGEETFFDSYQDAENYLETI